MVSGNCMPELKDLAPEDIQTYKKHLKTFSTPDSPPPNNPLTKNSMPFDDNPNRKSANSFCRYCTKRIMGDENYCPNCGKPLKKEAILGKGLSELFDR